SHPPPPATRPNPPLPPPKAGPRKPAAARPKGAADAPGAPKKAGGFEAGRRCPRGGVGSTRTESGHRVGKALKKRSSPNHTRRSETIKFSHRIDFLSTVFP